MPLNNITQINNEVIVKLGVSTSVAFYTDTILNTWLQEAHTWASSYHKWPFTEGRDQSTTWSGTEQIAYSSFPVEFKSDSIRILRIGEKRLKKLNFEDYLTFKEEESSSTDRVFADFGRTLWINPLADVSGTLAAFGQEQPADIDVTDNTATTVFSSYDAEGNSAIVDEMISYAKVREHKAEEAQFYHNKAIEKLENIWKRILDEQYKYQQHPASGGMWERIDVVNGNYEDELFKRDQF